LHWALGARALILAFFALLLGCAPGRHFSEAFEASGVLPARIDEGRGIRLLRVDGEEISRRSILVEPGRRQIRFEVRRALGSLDEERFQGIYQEGSCRIVLPAEAGKHYELYTDIFFEDREKIYPNRPKRLPRKTEMEKHVGFLVHVRDVETQRARTLGPESCELRLNCDKVNQLYSRTGSECHF